MNISAKSVRRYFRNCVRYRNEPIRSPARSVTARRNTASESDLKLIRDVMTEQGIAPGVMNVLVHYVLLKTDMKLSKGYLEKIASHWARKNVKTVRQAMNLAKAEHQKYQQWGKQKQTYRKRSNEVIPDWFNNQKTTKKKEEPSDTVSSDEIAERIKKLTSKGK